MTHNPEEHDRIPFLKELRGEFERVAQSQAIPTRGKRAAVVLVGIALITGGAFAGILVGSADHQVPRENGPAASFAASGTAFESLPELLAQSELVVSGTVEKVLPGELEPDEGPGPGPGPHPIRHVNAVARVEESLKGSAALDTVVIKTLEDAFANGSELKDWREPGQRVLVFLSPSKEEPGLYIPTWTAEGGPDYLQTIYTIRDEGDLAATSDDPLAARIAALPLSGVRQAAQVAEREGA